MRELRGIPAGRGQAAGVVARLGDVVSSPPSDVGADAVADGARAVAALDAVAAELRRRGLVVGGATADVLEAEALMADDPVLRADVRSRIASGTGPARALYDAFTSYRDVFAQASPYLAGRVADLDDVRGRAVTACLGVAAPGLPDRSTPYVLVARDLAPAELAVLDATLVLAIVTAEGGPTCHTAILARGRGIAAVVGCADALSLVDGEVVVVDGSAGVVTCDPSAELLADVVAGVSIEAARPLRGQTRDGRAVPLLANIGGPADVAAAVAAGAEGVGLFRTEFAFLSRDDEPTVAEQAAAYQLVFAAFPGAPVVVRVLDAGADKPLAFLDQGQEANPALGVRGLRALRVRPEVLDNQLAAIALAAAGASAQVHVLAPMAADAADARWFTSRARAAGVLSAGVVIEVPSAALTADAVLAECDVASIGTNDLAQYAFAADRQLGALGALQDPWQPAVLQLVRLAAAAGVAAGKPVGLCGEAAADPLLALVLVGLGVSSLSMAPGFLAEVRASLAQTSYDECCALAALALAAPDATTARAVVKAQLS